MRKGIFVLGLMLSVGVFAQTNTIMSSNFAKQGDIELKAGNYLDAIEAYKAALEKNDANIKAKYQLGECYRLIQDYESAEYYYEQVGSTLDIRYPLAGFYYPLMQKLKGNYDQALRNFKEFSNFMVANDLHEQEEYRYFYKQTKVEIDGCQLALNQITMVLPDYQFGSEAAPLNSPYNDYAAFTIGSDDIVCMTSARSNSKTKMLDSQYGEAFVDLYRFTKSSGTWQEYDPKDKFESAVNSKSGDGSGSFNRERNKFYYTYCDEEEGGCQIYVTSFAGGKWSEPMALNHNINEIGYSSKHPSLTPGGDTLFFSTDRKGGVGELDLWMSINAGGDNWGPAMHLGNEINTPFNEISPYYDQKDQVLFFASNGHRGFGGFDIFIARGTNFEKAEIYNAGLPFNSNRDDIFFFLGEKRGFLSSNRNEGLGKFDVYGFSIRSKKSIIDNVSSEETIAGRNSLFTDDYNFDNSETEIINQIISRMLSSSVSDVDLLLTERQLAVYNSLSLDDKERIDRIVKARLNKMTSNMIRSIRTEDDYYYQQLSSEKKRKVDNIVSAYLEQQGMGNSVSLNNDVLGFYNQAGSEEREKIDILISDRLKNAQDFTPAAPTYNSFSKPEQQRLDGIALKYLKQKRNLGSIALDMNEKVFMRDQQGSEEKINSAIRERLVSLSAEEKYRLVKEDRDFYESLTEEEKANLRAIAETFMVSDLTNFDQNVASNNLDVFKNKNTAQKNQLDKLLLKQISNLANSSLYLTETTFSENELENALGEDANETVRNLLQMRPDLSEDQKRALERFVKTTYDSYMVQPNKVFTSSDAIIASTGATYGDPSARLSNSDIQMYESLTDEKKRAIDNIIGLNYMAKKFYDRAQRLRDDFEASKLPNREKVHIAILSKKVRGQEIKEHEKSFLNAAFVHYNNLSEGRKAFYNRVVLDKAFESKNGKYILSQSDVRMKGQLTASEKDLMDRIERFRFNNERILTENLAVEAKDVDEEPVDIIALAANSEMEENKSEQLMTTEDILASEELGEVRISLPIDKIEGYSEITISGQLVGETSNDPLSSYEIKLVGYDKDATVVEGYTNADGFFDFTLIPAKYDITFKKAGAKEGVKLSTFNVEGKRQKDDEVSISATRAFFDVNSYGLRPEVTILLDEVAVAFRNSGNKIEIESHTDDTGTLEYNLELSKNRGYAARDYLMSKGIDKSDISVIWHGAGKPIADNNNPYGRQLNRRLDIRLIGKIEKNFGNYYLVRPGATVRKIATSLGIEESSIVELNGIKAEVSTYQPVRVKAGNSEPDYSLVVPADINSGKDFVYTVKPGDTLQKVSEQFNVPEELLMEQNNLSSTTLEAGTRLIIYPKN